MVRNVDVTMGRKVMLAELQQRIAKLNEHIGENTLFVNFVMERANETFKEGYKDGTGF